MSQLLLRNSRKGLCKPYCCWLQDPPSAYHILRQQLAQEHGQQQHHTAPQQQQQQQGAPQRQARWPRAADEVCKAISRRLKQAGSTAAVLQVVQHHAPQFNAVSEQIRVQAVGDWLAVWSGFAVHGVCHVGICWMCSTHKSCSCLKMLQQQLSAAARGRLQQKVLITDGWTLPCCNYRHNSVCMGRLIAVAASVWGALAILCEPGHDAP